MGDTDTSGALSVAGLPAHVRALLDEIRPAWEASGAARERETILAYLRLSGWLQVQRVADQVEARLHTEYSEGLVYESRVAAATARAEAAEQRAEALAAEVAQARADGFASGIHAAAEVLARRADAMSASGHHGYAYEVREVRLAVLEVLDEAQPAGEVSDG